MTEVGITQMWAIGHFGVKDNEVPEKVVIKDENAINGNETWISPFHTNLDQLDSVISPDDRSQQNKVYHCNISCGEIVWKHTEMSYGLKLK